MRILRTHSASALRAASAACVLTVCAAGTYAQSAPYKFDMGLNLGMSGYLGDANTSNPFRHPGFDADLSFRYIGDARWSVRTALSTFGLSGKTSDISDVLPASVSYSFNSQVYELSCRGEFNFLPYGIGETFKKLRRYTPYLAVGAGVAIASVCGKTYASPTIPMAFGFRYKPAQRWNLAVEFSMTKTFSDHFDGPELADLNMIKTAFYKNTDWFSRLTVGVSYEFGERCETCNYVD